MDFQFVNDNMFDILTYLQSALRCTNNFYNFDFYSRKIVFATSANLK